jgi:hypothetical protein
MPATTTNGYVNRASLWFGLFGGAIAWTIHFMAAYVVAEFGCVGGLGERSFWNISLVAWLELILTVAAVLVAAVSTTVAYRCQLRFASETDGAGAAQLAARYTARAGLLTSGIFTFVILFESIPILFYLHSC